MGDDIRVKLQSKRDWMIENIEDGGDIEELNDLLRGAYMSKAEEVDLTAMAMRYEDNQCGWNYITGLLNSAGHSVEPVKGDTGLCSKVVIKVGGFSVGKYVECILADTLCCTA